MRLIIDAGSTKTEWVVLDKGNVVDRFVLGGYNPNYNSDLTLIDLLYKDLPKDFPAMDEVYYYGTGCGSKANQEMVAQYLRVFFEEAKVVRVTHDLMAVCHALFQNEPGIACILGTGSNSCLYDGKEVVDQAVSLGYLVGDEGSGCTIGRKVVRAYFYDMMPAELKQAFTQAYHLELKDFIHNVYHEPGATKYLAGFCKFAGEHQDHPFMRQLVWDCFEDFIKVFVLRYDSCHDLPVSFVGSVAYHFRDLLRESLNEKGLSMGNVMQSPAEGLITYYQSAN